jgi:hypothetical protein
MFADNQWLLLRAFCHALNGGYLIECFGLVVDLFNRSVVKGPVGVIRNEHKSPMFNNIEYKKCTSAVGQYQ